MVRSLQGHCTQACRVSLILPWCDFTLLGDEGAGEQEGIDAIGQCVRSDVSQFAKSRKTTLWDKARPDVQRNALQHHARRDHLRHNGNSSF
jgi:hypothetical protein